MTDDMDKPLARSNVDRLTPWRAAIPDNVSPDFTLYVLADELEEPDEDELLEPDEERLDEVLPDSLSFWPG